MKLNFRKVASVIASVVMLGSTIGIAAAANYPAPFVQNGASSVGVVVGASAAVSDWSAALDLAQNLQLELAKQTATSGSSTSASTSGEAASLNSGSDLLYLGKALNTNVQTISGASDGLPVTLADGTFTDDDSNDYNYEQAIRVGSNVANTLAFSSAGSNLDDPTMLLLASSDTTTPLYNLTVTFDKAVNFTKSASEGQPIVLFGKTYTVGTATDTSKLVLLGGADTQTLNVGDTKTFTLGNATHTVVLTAISTSDTTPKAGVTVDGVAATLTQGQTKKVNGVDVYVKTVFKTGDNAGFIEMQLGSNTLTFESGSAVMQGTNDDSIDGTAVGITGGIEAMTKLDIAIAAVNSDTDYLLPGTAYTDPVFGAVKIDFAGAPNGPAISAHADTSVAREKIAVGLAGDRTLTVTLKDRNGVEKTIPFVYNEALSDKSGNTIAAIEGANIAKNGYTFIDSGDYSALWQVKTLSLSHAGTAKDDIKIEDVFSGESIVDLTDVNLTAGKAVTVAGQTFTITNSSATTVTITTSDYSLTSGSGYVQVYPYLSLVSGKDQNVAFAQTVTVNNVKTGTKFVLPDGTETLTVSNSSSTATASVSATAGTITFNVTATGDVKTNNTANVTFGVSSTYAAGGSRLVQPSILFVEDVDKAEATANTENGVVLPSVNSSDGSYDEMTTPIFTAADKDSSVFDDSDFTGYVDTFGTFVMKDSSDTHQATDWLTYSKEQMYADVFIAAANAVITPGTSTGGSVSALGSITVSDAEFSKVSSNNVIVVGGSCINTVAATLLGSAACGDGFTTATGVASGQFLIQSFANPNSASKVALVVAGYDAADTKNAVTYLTTQSPDTSVGKKFKGTTATSATLV